MVKNKEELINQKKAITKESDGLIHGCTGIAIVGKATNTNENKDEIEVLAVINTTNVLDSHSDVHIPGIWDKSLNENKRIMHVQEHKMAFDKIIASGEDLKAYVAEYPFKQLGFDAEGTTQALMFDSKIKESRNKYMFEQYQNGYVENHSVGMRYVKLVLAINDEEYGAEFEAWEKYYPQIFVGKEQAERQGYFWAVTEAKVIEGSAVPIGSNTITPTLEVKNEPPNGTQNNEPQTSTLNYNKIIKHFKSN